MIKHPCFLIDELDRSDEEFEAYLLELLSDFQITIPEIGTIRAKEPPYVILTSNRTREIHDALRRRCLYHWIDFPTLEKEYAIILARMPGIPERLAKQVCTFVRELRSVDLYKAPGVAETLDWISSLLALKQMDLVEGPVRDTLGALLKYQDDILKVGGSDLGKIDTESTGSLLTMNVAQPQDNGEHKAPLEMRPLDIERGERFLYRLTEFGRILWEVGISVGPGQMLDLAETLGLD